MRRPVLLLGLAAVIAAFPAWQKAFAACDGPETIFEDKFADDAGGWPLKETIEVKDGLFIFKLPPDDMQSNLNVTFTVKDADICSETVWPNDEQGDAWRGAAVLGRGQPHLFPVRHSQQRQVLDRAQAGRQMARHHRRQCRFRAIKQEPGAANVLRVKTNGNSVTFYINDTKVRELRGQAPKTDWRFGLSGDNFDKQKDARVVFKTVKVTN